MQVEHEDIPVMKAVPAPAPAPPPRQWSKGMWLPFAAAVLGGAIGVQLTTLMAEAPPTRRSAVQPLDPADQAHVHRLLEAVVLGQADSEARTRTLRYLVTTVELDDRTRNWALGELTGSAPAASPVIEEVAPMAEPVHPAALAQAEPKKVSVRPQSVKRAPAPEPAARKAPAPQPVAKAPAAQEAPPPPAAAAQATTKTAAPPEAPTPVALTPPPPAEPVVAAAPPQPPPAPAAPPAPPPPPKVTYAASLLEVDLARLDDSEGVAEIMGDRVGGLTSCYQPAVVGGTDLAAGELEVGFRISSGRVVRATPLFVGVDDEVVRCVVREVRGWRFGRATEGALSAVFQVRRL